MREEFISRAVVVAAVLWSTAVMLVGVTWLVAAVGVALEWVIGTALIAVLSMAIAAVWQIRLYVLRLCALVRVATGLDGQGGDIRTLNGRDRERTR